MAEFFLAVFIFLGVMAVTALIFGGWVVVKIFRGIGSMIGMSAPRPPARQMYVPIRLPEQAMVPPGFVQCRVNGCRHVNPGDAKFCRHCGHAFPPTASAVARRVAMV
jgi:hypothetical protein